MDGKEINLEGEFKSYLNFLNFCRMRYEGVDNLQLCEIPRLPLVVLSQTHFVNLIVSLAKIPEKLSDLVNCPNSTTIPLISNPPPFIGLKLTVQYTTL